MNGGLPQGNIPITPEIVNVTLFGKRVFADALQVRMSRIRSCWIGSGWVLSPMKMALIRDRREDTDTQRRQPHEEGGRDWE